jgi:hypothetical protein
MVPIHDRHGVRNCVNRVLALTIILTVLIGWRFMAEVMTAPLRPTVRAFLHPLKPPQRDASRALLVRGGKQESSNFALKKAWAS